MPLTQLDPAVRAPRRPPLVTRREPLQLEVSLAEAWPWPAMTVRAAARYGSALIRLRKLRLEGGRFILHDAELDADPTDALIVRTLLSLPSVDGVAYRASGGVFAPVLALIRLGSGNVVCRESGRIAQCRVLRRPPEPALHLWEIPSPGPLRLQALPSFRCVETGRDLGLPVEREESWWTFATAVSPASKAPSSAPLDGLFESGSREFNGAAAWALLRSAQALGPALNLRLSHGLAALPAAHPLRPSLHIEVDAENGRAASAGPGALKATLRFEPEGLVPATASFSPEEIISAAARGETCLRQGNVCVRLEPETVAQAREALAGLACLDGTPDQYRAADEQVPELLSWARARRQDAEGPWNVYVSESVAGAHPVDEETARLRLKLDVEEDGSESWLTLSAQMELAGRPLTAKEIERLMKLRRKWLWQDESWVRLDTEGLAAFRREAERLGLASAGTCSYRFRAEAREKVEKVFTLLGTAEHSEKYRAFLARLKSFDRIVEATPPAGWRLPLRPYQLQGLSWLRFLAQFSLNGILADDMGLGKTAQTLSLLSAMRNEHGPWPSLIVCPTSLVDNWRAEALKFDPRLRVLSYDGSPVRRDGLRRLISEQDLVLATYATVRNDANLLKEEQWRYLILDEAHVIKNAGTAVTKAVKTIPARRRLALTGTPVQNRLDELWSLFDFLMPGYLGSHADFFRRYEEPVSTGHAPSASSLERRRGELAAEALRERVKPFILRRLKCEVARELPEKIEQTLYCPLSADQAALYRTCAQGEEANTAVRELEERGASRAQPLILAVLSSLRKICNHPDLMYLAGEAATGKRLVPLPGYEERAGKLQALSDLLDACRDGGHRALVFCQSTSMLDILEHFLRVRGDACLRLDGATPGDERQGLVDRFNADPALLAFLISTRAGGCGLNLTGADTVIFYDHDWNPANDRQAMDRAHRIGQTRVVNVYRLVTQGTFEEKVLARQAYKLSLAQSVVGAGEGIFRDLTREDLVALFALPEGG